MGGTAGMDDAREGQDGAGSPGELRPFAGLDHATLRDLSAICRLRSYAAGQTVAHDGEPSEYIGCVRSGFLRMQKTLSDGRQQIVGLLVEGDMFGQVFSGSQHFAIEAATDADVWAFQRAPFEALLPRAPDLERVVLLNILNELDRARDWMVIVSGQRVTGKLAGFLLAMCSTFAEVDHILRNGSDGPEVTIPICRTDLANLLGTRPESLSRAFHTLHDTGEICLLKPDVVRILDIEALARRAGDDDLLSNPTLRTLMQVVARRA